MPLTPEQQARLDEIRRRPPPNGRPPAPQHRHAREFRREPTPRELQVLALLAEGATNGEIGVDLGIALTTVESHVKRLLLIFEARSRPQLVANGFRRGHLV